MEWLERAWENPEQRAHILRWLWLVSTGFTLLGFALIFYIVFVQK
jgi:phage shock protein PspC (stress-responsive transcriptional regulator)